MHLKLAAYLTYAIGLRNPGGYVRPALYWDTEDPYHYVRTKPAEAGKDLLIVGGEDHKTGRLPIRAAAGRSSKPGLVNASRPQGGKCHWSGEIFETPDGLGLIGLAPGWRENVYVITGDSGMGMTHGTLGRATGV